MLNVYLIYQILTNHFVILRHNYFYGAFKRYTILFDR
jgi:hypothetical protein